METGLMLQDFFCYCPFKMYPVERSLPSPEEKWAGLKLLTDSIRS